MPRKQPMSFAEHQSLGREMKALCQSLIDISVNLQTTYGVTSKVGKLAKKASTDIERLRCALENQAGKDCPTQDPMSFKGLYYGE